jgi:hypothetical protein
MSELCSIKHEGKIECNRKAGNHQFHTGIDWSTQSYVDWKNTEYVPQVKSGSVRLKQMAQKIRNKT